MGNKGTVSKCLAFSDDMQNTHRQCWWWWCVCLRLGGGIKKHTHINIYMYIHTQYSYLVFHPSSLIQVIFQIFFIRSDLILYALYKHLYYIREWVLAR